MPLLRISNVTYQIGVAAPVNVIPRTVRPVAWCERLDPGKKRHNRIYRHPVPNGSRFIDVNQGAPGGPTKGSSPYQ
jgi:predicted NAD/FAD-binding protein